MAYTAPDKWHSPRPRLRSTKMPTICGACICARGAAKIMYKGARRYTMQTRTNTRYRTYVTTDNRYSTHACAATTRIGSTAPQAASTSAPDDTHSREELARTCAYYSTKGVLQHDCSVCTVMLAQDDRTVFAEARAGAQKRSEEN